MQIYVLFYCCSAFFFPFLRFTRPFFPLRKMFFLSFLFRSRSARIRGKVQGREDLRERESQCVTCAETGRPIIVFHCMNQHATTLNPFFIASFFFSSHTIDIKLLLNLHSFEKKLHISKENTLLFSIYSLMEQTPS